MHVRHPNRKRIWHNSFSQGIGIHAITLEKMHTLAPTHALLSESFPMRDYARLAENLKTQGATFSGGTR